MDEKTSNDQGDQELLYFWALGDLHFRDHEEWKALHTPRMACMFEDMRAVWSKEGKPAFCVSPGDLVDSGATRNYHLARKEIAAYLGDLPFYPGLGNHEYYPEDDEESGHSAEEYSAIWGKPVRYAWTAGTGESVICIMLDHFFGSLPDERGIQRAATLCTPETLAFLEATLAEHANRRAVIFAHCPLHNTVLDRDPVLHLDDDSLTPFFYVKNSPEVRAIFARHSNSALYLSGHTHAGWGSPRLIFTEILGTHPLTHINLMCPWYTGYNGAYTNPDGVMEYRADNPDMLSSFAIHIYSHKALIRMRDHRARQWLQEWEVPLTSEK